MSKEKVNKNCPGVKRLMREAAELAEPTEHYYAAPLEDNLFEWHFTVRGQEGSSFEGGLYHGRIMFPPEYPLKPPSVMLLTPNGRFEINRKICLSMSEYHPETWQPSWSIRTVLLAIVGFMPTPGKGAIGALDWTDAERKKLALQSVKWSCRGCGADNADVLLPVTKQSGESLKKEADKAASEMAFTAEKSKSKPGDPPVESAASVTAPPPTTEPNSNAAVSPAPVAPAPDAPVATPETAPQNASLTERPPPTGGIWTLFIMYFLVGIISALFLRRAGRTIYQEFFKPDLV
ncbi:ubiquitin-conjugating enzyme E2 J1-like [Bolinopsis microptera]|uniref:ubiquitin-conjugating enzyme E2 J1-like n=1 Tax=Bolinopsis microptera TaxID=2820187 RepID=UPI00307B0B6F